MNQFIKIFLYLICCTYLVLGLFSYTYAQDTTTCRSLYLDSFGQCATDCATLGSDYMVDSKAGLCEVGESCCHKSASTSGVASFLELQIPLFDYAQAANLPEYIYKIYQYATIIIVPLAIIMIIIGGIMWISAGGANEKITSAKKFIINALIGLALALFSYIFLSLVGIDSLKMPGLEKIQPEGGDIFFPMPANFIVSGAPGNSFCPKSGGAAAIQNIANGALGKVTYRMGGKPWKQQPPFTTDTMTCDGQPCKNFCPSGQLCLDCSGFMSYLYLCAGLESPPSFTGEIFKTCEKITSTTATSVNGIELKPGDLVGYPPSGCGQEVGHVLIYVGNGNIAQSHGGGGTSNPNSGRISGKAILISPFANWAKSHTPCGCISRIK